MSEPDIAAIMEQVKRLANCMMRAGQRPTIERDDLVSVGMLSVVRDISNGVARQGKLLRHAKSFMICHIQTEKGHWRGRKSWEEMFDDNGREKF